MNCSIDNTDQKEFPIDALMEIKDDVILKFGPDSIWLLLVLLPMIDTKTWSFENISQAKLIGDMMQYIEENDKIKNLFMSKENQNRSE